MRRILKIDLIGDNKIICIFKNGEQRLLDLKATLKDKFGKLVINDESTYSQATIGEFGEIMWEGIAQMKGSNGENIKCNYDMSPEFAYKNSTIINSP